MLLRLIVTLIRPVQNAFLAPFLRRRAQRALQYAQADLGIDWPVWIRFRRDLRELGRASSAVKHAIDVRTPQDLREAELTVLHETYHLAQFHKWRDLDPRRRKIGPDEVERADSLAELYAQLTAREMRRAARRPKRG